MNTREQNLAAALLWLRNHYDVEPESNNKIEVLRCVDLVLADGPDVQIKHMVAFRHKYPRQAK
jgi:hypothetical protein